MKSGKFTARSLVEKYSRAHRGDRQARPGGERGDRNESRRARRSPRRSIEERKAKGPRGPLHGIPVLIKDNIDTADRMMTTAGSLALGGLEAAQGFVRRAETCARPAR